MKKGLLSYLTVFLVLVLALVACRPRPSVPAPTAQTQTSVTTPAPAPVSTPVPAPQATPAPTAKAISPPAPKATQATAAKATPAPASVKQPSAEEVHKANLAKWIEGAKKEGTLTYWSTGTGKEIQGLVAEFNKKYPFVKIESWRGNTDDQFEKLFAEYKAGKRTVDLFTLDPNYLPIMLKNNLLRKMDYYWAKNWPAADNDPGGRYWVQSYINLVIEYNTKLVKPEDVPKSFEELTTAKWRKKVAVEQNAIHWFLALSKAWGLDKATEYINKLKANEALLYRGHTHIRDLNTAGEFPIASEMYLFRIIQDMEKKKAPIDWTAPFVASAIMYSGSLEGSPNPNAAQLWHEWITSPQGQKFYADFTFRSVGDPNVSSAEDQAIAKKGNPKRVVVPGLFQGENYEKAESTFRGILWPK